MSHYPDWLALSKGSFLDHILVNKFGHNDTVGTSYEPVTDLSVTTANYDGWLTTADVVQIAAGGDAADAAAGAGAQSITVYGLDASFALQEVDIDCNADGTLASDPTTETWIRVFRAKVKGVGTYGVANTADITIEDSSNNALIRIPAGEGQTQCGLYTIPAGYTGFMSDIRWYVDSSQAADLRLVFREAADDATTPFAPRRTIQRWKSSVEFVHTFGKFGITIPEKTDIIPEAKASSNTEVGVSYDIVLIKNTLL